MPMHFSDKMRNRLKMGKRYHSGKISKGVEKALAWSSISKPSWVARPAMLALMPKITIGKMYKISLGHAGSP